MNKRANVDRKERDRSTAIAKLLAFNVTDARKKLRAVFADNGYDYPKTGRALGCHHYTIRRWARALDLTTTLANDRIEAIEKGLVPNVFGRPKKKMPTTAAITKALRKHDYSIEVVAKVFRVSAPTIRAWCKELGVVKPGGVAA